MIKTNPDITIIDLREEKDYCDIGFDCISIPYYEINNRISFVLEKNGVVFYCKNGIQSANVINYFQRVHKMENLYHLIL
jgi:rhodanese-related sulfurtransferase